MSNLLLLWLGLFGLVLFISFDEDFAKAGRSVWMLGSGIVAAMLAVPVFLILLAIAKTLTR